MEKYNHDQQFTLAEIKELARRGKLRFRAFGEEDFYGVGHPFYGDLARAADELDRIMQTGMVALYYDQNGLFLGPSNPKFVADIASKSPRKRRERLQ